MKTQEFCGLLCELARQADAKGNKELATALRELESLFRVTREPKLAKFIQQIRQTRKLDAAQ
jgi:hypothetical protein